MVWSGKLTTSGRTQVAVTSAPAGIVGAQPVRTLTLYVGPAPKLSAEHLIADPFA